MTYNSVIVSDACGVRGCLYGNKGGSVRGGVAKRAV